MCSERFRVTYLRRNRVPENVLKYWIGHANKTVTDGYDKVNEASVITQIRPCKIT
jgi:hypothetical protein